MPDIGGVDEAKLAEIETRFLQEIPNLTHYRYWMELLLSRCQTQAWEGSLWLEVKEADAYNKGYEEGYANGQAVEHDSQSFEPTDTQASQDDR